MLSIPTKSTKGHIQTQTIDPNDEKLKSMRESASSGGVEGIVAWPTTSDCRGHRRRTSWETLVFQVIIILKRQ